MLELNYSYLQFDQTYCIPLFIMTKLICIFHSVIRFIELVFNSKGHRFDPLMLIFYSI